MQKEKDFDKKSARCKQQNTDVTNIDIRSQSRLLCITNLAEIDDSFFIIIYNISRKSWWYPLSRKVFNSKVKTTASDLQWTSYIYTYAVVIKQSK